MTGHTITTPPHPYPFHLQCALRPKSIALAWNGVLPNLAGGKGWETACGNSSSWYTLYCVHNVLKSPTSLNNEWKVASLLYYTYAVTTHRGVCGGDEVWRRPKEPWKSLYVMKRQLTKVISAGNQTRPPQHSRKEPFEQLVNSYSEHLHMSMRPRRMLVTCSPSACVTWTYMNWTRMQVE